MSNNITIEGSLPLSCTIDTSNIVQSNEHPPASSPLLCNELLTPSFSNTIQAIDVLLTTHRDPEEWIPFHQKREGKMPMVGGILAGELSDMFPLIANYLIQDSYAGVNGYFSAQGKTKYGIPYIVRREKNLRRLNCIYIDCDCGRPNHSDPAARMHASEAQGIILRAASEGVIPIPSITAFSGQGCYVFWMLHDENDPSVGKRVFLHSKSDIELYKQINIALQHILRGCGLYIDSIKDAARVLRVPYSTHKCGNKVIYSVHADSHGVISSYTMSSLAKLLNISTVQIILPQNNPVAIKEPIGKLTRPRRTTKNRGTAPKRNNSRISLHKQRVYDIVIIADNRGGILEKGTKYPDGSISPGRRVSITFLATALRWSGHDLESTRSYVKEFALSCRPSYPSKNDDPPIDEILKDVFKEKYPKLYSNETLCSMFGITSELASTWELSTIIPTEVRNERKAYASKGLVQQKIARLSFAKEYLKVHTDVSCRQLAKAYAEQGLKSNHQTANKDMNALGYMTHKKGCRGH